MFDELFKKEDTQPQETNNTTSGMFGELFDNKQTNQPVIKNIQEQPSIESFIPKNKFLNKVGEFFLGISPTTSVAYNAYKANKALEKVAQPIIDRSLNTPLGKEIITTTEKATRGSSLFRAVPSAIVETLSDKIAGVKTDKDIVDYYDQAVSEWEKGGQDPAITFPNKVARGVLDSGIQSGIGVLLNFIPFIGKTASTTYYGALSASEQINERGEVNSLGNIAIDVIGDRILGDTLEGLFKKPAKDLVKTGFVETLKQGGKGFLVEGTTEPAQTILKYANDYRVAKTPEERSRIIDETKNYVKNGGMLLEFLVGGISGAGISSIASLASQSQIDPNIPKPKIGITEDEDKKFSPEQNKVREAFREDIKQDLTDTGMNKPYVSRQISNETGIDHTITTLMVDEVAETMKTEPTTVDINDEDIIQQALNEAGTVLEETKPEETIVEQPKLKISKEEPLITEAKKYKSAEEFVKAQGKPVYHGTESNLIDKINKEGLKSFDNKFNIPGLSVSTKEDVAQIFADSKDSGGAIISSFISPKAKITTLDEALSKIGASGSKKIADETKAILWAKDNNFDVIDLTTAKSNALKDMSEIRVLNPEVIKTKSQLEEIYKQAHEGEAKMKISDEADKFGLTPSMKDNIVKILDDYIETGGKDIELQKDAGLIAEELGLGEYKTYGALTNKLRDILEKSDQYYKGLDTLKTKEDNKEYERENKKLLRETKEGEQSNRGRDVASDGYSDIYKLEEKQRGDRIRSDTPGNGGNKDGYASKSLPRNETERNVRRLVSELLPEVEPKTIDKIVSYYSRLDKEGIRLDINRQTTNKYDAAITPYPHGLYQLSISNIGIEKLSPETIDHEIGTHIYYPSLLNSGRESLFNGIKEQYKLNPEKFSEFDDYHQKSYWMLLKDSLVFQIRKTNLGMNFDEADDILRQADIIDENNEVIFPEDIMEATFNFKPISDKLNKVLEENGYRTTDKTNEYNNLMAEEIVAFVAENSESFKDSTIPVVNKYTNDILNNTLEFKKPERTITFGTTMLKLKESTNLTSDDILKKHADIELKRDITITDVYGNKAVLKQGEGITPYEMKGNKYILQDGEAYLVSKSQAQNVINNSKTGEAKPFAPELEQTEETIKGDVKINTAYKGWTDFTEKMQNKYGTDSTASTLSKLSSNERITWDNLKAESVKLEKELGKDTSPTKYSQYTLPGGENYKEILIKAPVISESEARQANADKIAMDLYGKTARELWDSGKMDEWNKVSELNKTGYGTPAFRGSHWEEPNVISHIRMNERTYNGKKVAFMEELQSDWAREARKDRELTSEEKQRLADYKKRGYGSLNNEELADLNRLNRNEVPTNPLLKNWQELSIKRALQEAVNSNAKYFAWITGEQTSARYNLSKEVDRIEWKKYKDEENIIAKQVDIYTKTGGVIGVVVDDNGKILTSKNQEWKDKNIVDVIGKGIGEKIMSSPLGKLEGEGLNIGGEWAKNLYDKQVKAIVENLTGQKVEMLDMGLPVDKNQQFFKIKVDGISRDLKNLAFISSGDEVTIGRIGEGVDEYIVTDILGNGKFKAVKQEQWELLDAEVFLNEKDAKKLNELWNKNQSTLTQTEKSERDELFKKSDENKSKFNIVRIPNDLEIETFDISEKKSVGQMAIEITPEVKAIIKGEAPQLAKPSGKLPFAEQAYAPIGQAMFSLRKPTLEELKKNLAQTQKALDKAVANPEVYGQNSIVNLNQKVADLRKQIMEAKYPKVDTGDKITDAKTVLENIEKKLGVSSVVNSLKEKQSLIELSKEVLEQSPMAQLEPYVADAGAYKDTLPEVTGKNKEELKKNPDFKGVKNEKTFEFAQKGDSIAQEITSEYGMDMDSNEVRAEFEDYQIKKENLKEEEKKVKQEAMRFGKTDTFQILGKDKSLIGEITETRGVPLPLKEIMDQVREEKKARREEVLNHPARPLMKYVDKKTNKLPEVGSNTAFGKSSDQILKDLGFDDVKQANRDIQDYIAKRDEFVNPISRLRMQERAAKFLRDKAKIMEEVERKVRAEARDRKSKIEAIRDFFYMTNTEIKEVIGDVDYRLVSDKQFEEILKNLEEKSIEIAERQVAVAEVEWTIAQKELHRVENLMELMGYPKNLSELTIEQLNNLNDTLSKFQHGDVFLGVREMETLMKNAKLNVQTQREILQEVIGKRTNVPIEEINKITATQFDKFRSAVSLARQNPFYEIMVNDAYALKVEAAIRYQEIENKTNELVKKARESRRRTLVQRLIPTDDMVIAYLEEGDLDTKQKIAKDMSKDELELAHYIQDKYIEMRDYLMSLDQLERYRKDYVTHRPRGFFEAWLRDGATKSPKQFIVQFAKAFKETVFDVHKVDSAAFNITSEKGKEILPLEKFFKYSMRRSGQLIPTRNIAKAFLGYVNTFEVKRGLDKYVPRMEAVARALTPQETTEGGLIKDTTLENFVAQWINTQKGRPLALKFINPGDTLDTLLRAGVAFTRTLDLALRIPAQVMSLVGEESATWINIGNKRYLLGQYRAKTAQGKNIAKKYEGLVGKSFWDKMRDDSKTFENKLGETMFAFYGIAAKKANVHHLLGSLTKQEFESGEISTERLGAIKQEMTKWRADDVLSSVMGKTSIGQVFREHKSWAIPIFTQTLSNLQDIKNMVASGEFKTVSKSKQFGELFRATTLTLILVLTLSKWYKDLKDKRDRSIIEEVQYRAMNDALSFMSALSPKTLFVTPRLMAWIDDLSNAISTVIGAMSTGEKTAEGKTPGLAQLKKSFTPKLFSEMLKDTEQDKVMASISKTTSTAQKQVEGIKKDIVEPAQLAWEKVKELGVGTEEADAVVNELSDDEYEAYKIVKKADTDYWVEIAKKVTPTVQEAYKVGFGTEEADALIEDLSDDEYAMYKKVKQALYGKEDEMGKDEWDEQTFKEHIVNMAKGWATDPVTAFDNLIHGDWKILGVRNGQIIVNRMPKSASTEIREKAMKNNEKWKLDHTVPLKGGGTNRSSNLSLIPTEEWEENTPVELYLIEQLKDGKIDGDKLREYIIRYKVGVGRNVDKKIIKEYNKKYDGKPITFQEIKNEIEGR